MNKITNKLPGKGIRILSFIPVFNCFALIYIGAVNSNTVNMLCGAVYFIISIAIPNASAFFWIACIIHYSIAYRGVKKQMMNSTTIPIPFANTVTYSKPTKSEQQFSDITLSGVEECTQSIPTRLSGNSPSVSISFSYESSQDKFFTNMKNYENKSGTVVPFEPFMTYWPTYESMTKGQKNWYFYWRTEARSRNYIDTDLSYIFIYIYELLSGVGWKTPQEGYDKLIELWKAYQQRFPKLDGYLHSWTFDFAKLHNLEYTKTLKCNSLRLTASPKTDLLIDQFSSDVPLKLPFDLIDALCDYSLVGSKFYKDGNQPLIQEAIPRVVALADAVMRKQKNKGILETYVSSRTKKQEYYTFASALCPQANKKITISVKAYSSSQRLRCYINELVRYGENTLRALKGYRGRLRGVTLDEETSKIVESFLKNEYGTSNPAHKEPPKETLVELDFASIDILRQQSDAVRSALKVEQVEQTAKKELLTDVAEVTAIYVALSSVSRSFLNRLQKTSWKSEKDINDETAIVEINRLAEFYLGCNLLVVEDDNIIAEDDYQDELDYIYKNPPQIASVEGSKTDFNVVVLSESLQELIKLLVPEQRKVLYAIVVQENPEQELERIAEEMMTMPQILLDDINNTAMQILGDIIIDPQLQVIDEYITELKKSTI